jgi:hypothetical protein
LPSCACWAPVSVLMKVMHSSITPCPL